MAKNRAHFSALTKAAAHGHAHCVQVLIEAGADLGAQSRVRGLALVACHESRALPGTNAAQLPAAAAAQRLWTPLHYACDLGRTDCARVLIEAGANVNARNVVRAHTLTSSSARTKELFCQLPSHPTEV